MKIAITEKEKQNKPTFVKTTLDDKTPAFVVPYFGFARDYHSMLSFFGLVGIDNHQTTTASTGLLLSEKPFNGILVPTSYVKQLCNGSKGMFDLGSDKEIVESGEIRDIPVLFSKILLMGTNGWPIHPTYEEYLRSHFDHVYAVTTKREIVPNGPLGIVHAEIDSTRKVYLAHEHPIEQWKLQMARTNRIRIELTNKL